MSDATLDICTVVGARPQFVKAGVVSPALERAGVRETVVHTGQHYDDMLSGVFFDELTIPRPAVNLDVGSAAHGRQTGRMMERLEAWLLDNRRFDGLLVYGDTNSTLAGALVAAKLHLPVVHVEAGLRSYNRRMPEEINRTVVDRISDLLCCPTANAVENLRNEGIVDGVHQTGDVMRDAVRTFGNSGASAGGSGGVMDLPPDEYYLATVHRAENTDARDRLDAILRALGDLDRPVVMPLHPRTRARLGDATAAPNIDLREPVNYGQMLRLIRHARTVLTDSGGVQKESCWLATPCVTLREETEWTGTMEGGWNRLVGAEPRAILEAVYAGPDTEEPPDFGAPPTGDSAADFIARLIVEFC